MSVYLPSCQCLHTANVTYAFCNLYLFHPQKQPLLIHNHQVSQKIIVAVFFSIVLLVSTK